MESTQPQPTRSLVAVDFQADEHVLYNEKSSSPHVLAPSPGIQSPAGSVKTAVATQSSVICASGEEAPEKDGAINIPPDGGFLAWSQVLAGHLVAFNAWGFINSFGIFQAYLTASLSRPPADISWVGGVQIFLMLFVGVFSGRALDAGYYRPFAIAGLALQIFGIMMTSLVTEYWQLLLAMGFCQGLGNGLIFTPTMAVVSTYFVKKRAVAIMGMSSGTATGGIIFPIIARQLLDKVGFGWTIRVMGFIFIFNAVVVLTLIRPRLHSRKSGPVVELKSFLDPWYGCCAFGLFFCTLGLYFGYFYVTSFAEDIIHASPTNSFDILLGANAMGLPGRFIPAYLADRYLGPLNTLLISATITGVTTFAWAGVTDIYGTWAFALVFGFFGSSISTFFPPALANTGRDPAKVGMEIGMCFALIGLGCLCGPPIAGIIITDNNGGYFRAQMFAGTVMLLGTFLVSISRFISTGPRIFARV